MILGKIYRTNYSTAFYSIVCCNVLDCALLAIHSKFALFLSFTVHNVKIRTSIRLLLENVMNALRLIWETLAIAKLIGVPSAETKSEN